LFGSVRSKGTHVETVIVVIVVPRVVRSSQRVVSGTQIVILRNIENQPEQRESSPRALRVILWNKEIFSKTQKVLLWNTEIGL